MCTILVYRKVQKYDRITLKYRRPEVSFGRMNSRSPSDGSLGFAGASTGSPNNSNTNTSLSGLRGQGSLNGDDDNNNNGNNLNDDASARLDEMGDNNSAFLSAALGQIDEREADAYAEETKGWNIWSAFVRWRLRQQMFREDNPRTAEVFQQALWYLGVFYITHVWSTTNRTIQLINHGRTYFGVIVIHSFFDPLQGFLNFLVYQRPRYMRFRKADPGVGVSGAMKKTLQFSVNAGGDEWVRRSLRRSSSPFWRSFGGSQRFSSSRNVSLGEFSVKGSRLREVMSSVSGISELERESKLADNASVEVEPAIEMKHAARKKVSSTLPMDDSECETNPLQTEVKHCPPSGQEDESKLADPLNEETHGKDEAGEDAKSSVSSRAEVHENTPR